MCGWPVLEACMEVIIVIVWYSRALHSLSLARWRMSAGHITNLARNSSGLVWSLQRLERELGGQRYAQLWAAMMRSLRLCLGAASGPMQAAHQWLK
jgi:hypothetical protein